MKDWTELDDTLYLLIADLQEIYFELRDNPDFDLDLSETRLSIEKIERLYNDRKSNTNTST